MDPTLAADLAQLDAVLAEAHAVAAKFLRGVAERPVGVPVAREQPEPLPEHGLGAAGALARFQARHLHALSGSAGPRYLGFVTGGATPAALAGDWLTGAFDQNAADTRTTAAGRIEHEALTLLRDLLRLPPELGGVFVSGATMANVVGIATARQALLTQRGLDPAQDGLAGMLPLTVLSGAPHSCIAKGLSILGIGRARLRTLPLLPGREAVDVAALQAALAALDGAPAIVVGNAGTVNSVDFDDLRALRALCDESGAWLHVDAAFGGFAACSPRFAHLSAGMEQADSLAIDLHKWLNVPYDSAVAFTRRRDAQAAVFNNSAAAYLGFDASDPDLLHLTPENSRRLRALPAWMTLTAYGAAGQRAVVERCCDMAAWLGAQIERSAQFQLLAPVRMNVVCFTLAGAPDAAAVRAYLDRLNASGETFMTATVYGGVAGIRAAFSNWRTEEADVARVWSAMTR